MRTICRIAALAIAAALLAACTSPSSSPVLPYTSAHAVHPQDTGGGIPDVVATPPPA